MLKPDQRIIQRLASAVREYPELLEFLRGAEAHELAQLPWAVERPALYQGRCQTYKELIQFFESTPDMAAKR